jgi:hypothetical protein
MNKDIRYGKGWYVLSIIMLLVGIAAFTYMLVINISNLNKSSRSVTIPGKADLLLDKAGKYTIFYEKNHLMKDEFEVPAIKCSLVNKSNNELIELKPSLNSNYSINNRKGKSILKFSIKTPGIYKLSALYESGKDSPKANVTIVRGFMSKLLISILGGIVVLGGSIVISVILFVVTYNKRSKVKTKVIM